MHVQYALEKKNSAKHAFGCFFLSVLFPTEIYQNYIHGVPFSFTLKQFCKCLGCNPPRLYSENPFSGSCYDLCFENW
jgi:hypothetical protein